MKKEIEESKEDKILREAILRLEMRKVRTLVNELNKLILKEEKDAENKK